MLKECYVILQNKFVNKTKCTSMYIWLYNLVSMNLQCSTTKPEINVCWYIPSNILKPVIKHLGLPDTWGKSFKLQLMIRDRPFNLQSMGFFFVQKNFFGQHELEYLCFFSKFNMRLYDKNSESDYFFFLHQNQNMFSATLGIRIFF